MTDLVVPQNPLPWARSKALYAERARSAHAACIGSVATLSMNMLGGASQVVRRIRTKCNRH